MTTSTTASESPAADNRGGPTIELFGRRLHFVGIGGCGMSGLARLASRAGAVCSGSDAADNPTTEALRGEGFRVFLQQSADTVPEGCQMVIASAAIPSDHPEVVEAARRRIPVLKYAQFLGQLMIGTTAVAIAGTHGKSTTASMLAYTLLHDGQDPSFIIGATCQQIGGGGRCGEQDLLIAEACEFDRSFHHLHPTHAVILNVEEDHMDVYRSIDEIVEAFSVFAKRLPHHGSLVINHEMAHRLTITAGLDCQIETIGFAPLANWRIELRDQRNPEGPAARIESPRPPRSTQNPSGGPWVRLYREENLVAQWPAAIPGEHMAYNAAVAAVTAHRLGVSWNRVSEAMASFQGLDRRMQLLGYTPAAGTLEPDTTQISQADRITVVDDYGHHPTEIDTTLRALRRHYQPRRLICVFQPHQHSRTRFLIDQFATSFSEADIVIVPHIYFVRDSENERHTVSARDLVDRLRQRGKQAMHLYPFAAITEQLEIIACNGDLLVTMGAGDVWKVARGFLDEDRRPPIRSV